MSKKTTSTSVAARGDGRDVIRAAARNLPSRPGVYRMIDSRGHRALCGQGEKPQKAGK
jgi:hypothetical protein